jgi:hypothetical protein
MAGTRVTLKATVAAVPMKYNVFTILTSLTMSGVTYPSGWKPSTGISKNVSKLEITNDDGPGNLFIGDGTLAPSTSPPAYEKKLLGGEARFWGGTGNMPSPVSLGNKWVAVDTDDCAVNLSIDP